MEQRSLSLSLKLATESQLRLCVATAPATKPGHSQMVLSAESSLRTCLLWVALEVMPSQSTASEESRWPDTTK